MQSFTSVPFKTETHHGLSSINGVAKFSRAGVVLEFEAKLLGLIGGGVKEVQIRKEEILDVKFRKGFVKRGAKIEIRLKSMARLQELPNKEGKIVLKIATQDWDLARDAIESFEKASQERADSLPPAHTPVSVLFDETEADTEELK